MMVETPPQPRYEFFISRAGADAAVAKEVADVLRHAGHTVQYQDEDIPFGANFIERMSQLVEGCKHLLVILSPAYLGSPYCREEWTNFLADLFADQDDRRVVVLLAHDCKPPGILRARVFGSLFDKTDPAERRTTILSAAEGRAARTKIDPALFQVPVPHNPAFCGRDNVFAELDDALIASVSTSKSDIAPIAIAGAGGVGKSSIAAEYAYRHSGDYWGVWWIPAQSHLTLVASLSDLASRIDPRLSLPASTPTIETRNLEPLAKTALSRLKGAPLPWLLIYDNVHDPSVLADWLPPTGVHVLITTRWSDWHGVAGEVDLDVFSPEISQDYLLKRTNSKDKLGAARLAAALDFLPLALEQAGALCKRTGLSFDDYGRRLSEFIRVKPAGSSYPQSIFGTFSIAIDDAAAYCPDAERLLGLLAFLAPDIPLDIIDAAAMDIVDRTRAAEALTAVSLVAIRDEYDFANEIAHKRVRVHLLVQEVMRQRVHEKRAFPSLRTSIYEILKSALAGKEIAYGPAWESVLLAVHYDPSENASLQVEYAHNADIDIELTFTKRSDGILHILRAMDGGRPFHRIETLYYLDGGWKSRKLSNRMF